MVETQIRARGVADPRVLEAFLRVPRHEFVPPLQREFAYEDRALPVGLGQTISQPYMVALMTEALGPLEGRRILEVGTGSGYQAAILAALGAEVWTVERLPVLALRAQERLVRLGFAPRGLRIGDGSRGWPEAAPFDGIVVTAGAPEIPTSLRRQLAEGGRLVIPTGGWGLQELVVLERRGAGFHEWRRGTCAFVPLIGEEGWKP
jgi:protein-L-isoaspartate(D-aspartate) O-methyltransferase